MKEDHNAEPASAHGLEHPALVALGGNTLEKQDTLASSGMFSLSPFYYATPADRLEDLSEKSPSSADPPATINNKKLAALRKSPAARLLSGSLLRLKAWQLDMDCPPSARDYIKDQLSRYLLEKTGQALSPDDLHISFETETNPAIQADGREHYAWRLSLTELGVASFAPASFLALIRCAEADRPLHDAAPVLTTHGVIDLIMKSFWTDDYQTLLETFWARHETTYRALARLSFLEGAYRQYTQRKLSLDGYNLALDVLGLDRFPTTSDRLEQPVQGQRAVISMVSINGHIVPGIFQLKSKITSHCFIHTLGEKPGSVEYISDEPTWMTQKLLDALNATPWLAPYLDVTHSASVVISSTVIEGDLFSALTAAQKTFSLERLATRHIEPHIDSEPDEDGLLLKPIERAMTIVSALDLWESQPEILQRIPDPLKTAQRTMRSALIKNHQLDVDPDHVFIRYLRGTSTTPWGDARSPTNYVHTPDEKPISLGEALLSHYRVEQPVGYTDNGGRTVVYLDPTGKGQWSETAEIAVSAEAIEGLIRNINFPELMSRRFQQFWDAQGEIIEQSFTSTFMARAVVSLKQGHLSRAGFDLLVEALDRASSNSISTDIRCKTLGVNLQSSLTDAAQCQSCAGLLLFTQTDTPLTVLYQAGQINAFVEFAHSGALEEHLQTAAEDMQWRATLLHYVPVSLHQKFSYVLEVWAGIRPPTEPVSLLRPWTDGIYANHMHQGKPRILCEQPVTSSPFAFMRNTLKQNHLDDADARIVTSREVSLRYWTRQLNHLQLLLAPLSLLLTPAMLASLAVHAGSVYLSIETAALPGNRDAEKKQAILAALSFGLLGVAPYTPRLLRAFGTFTVPLKPIASAANAVQAQVQTRVFGTWLRRSISTRKTRLETFFGTHSLLKSWSVPGHPSFGTLPVKVWKLDHKFLLWTSDRGQARTLVVSTHGYYAPWSKTAPIPNGTELRAFAPHGYELVDPGLHRVVSQKVGPFALLNTVDNSVAAKANSLPPYVITNEVLAGTALPGRIKNYSLSKFQSTAGETYQDISHIVRNSNVPPWGGQLPATPMDVLTVRNRFGMTHPSLEDLFKSLAAQGIHYDKILLLHCRCSAINSLLGLSPVYRVPVNPLINP